jgi:hypothetical protein
MASQKNLDFTPVQRRSMGVSRVSGRAGLLFAGFPVPRHRVTNPANDSLSQFERVEFSGEHYASPVASRHCVNAGAKLTGRLLVKAAEIRATGSNRSSLNAYVPVTENKAYLTSGREARARNPLNLKGRRVSGGIL